MLSSIILLFVLILFNAFFSAAEMAFVSLNDTKVDLMADEGNAKAIILNKILKEPTRFLSTIQIFITLAGFLNSAFAADSFAQPMADALRVVIPTLAPATLRSISVVIITLILAIAQIVLGELVPKRIAMKYSEPFSFTIAKAMSVLSFISYPLVKFLTISTNIVLRLFGIDPKDSDEGVSEEEIRMMVDAGQEKGGISTSERLMINNVFDFDNLSVEDIMTHRTEVEGIEQGLSLNDIIEVIDREKYTRFPVYKDTLDNVVGILHVKDLFHYLSTTSTSEFSVENVTRPPYFVPDSKKTSELFMEFQRDKVHMAVVIDEYGGTAGLVTMEDMIEEIVGDVFDEYDDEEIPDYKMIAEGEYIIQGSMDLEDVQDLLDIQLPVDDYDTLSGFIVGELGYLPNAKDHSSIVYSGYRFTILSAVDRVVKQVRVEKIELVEAEKNSK